MVIYSYHFVYKLYNFFSYVVCRYHIFSCPTTHILSTQYFCHTTRVNISTGVTVPVTVTESTSKTPIVLYLQDNLHVSNEPAAASLQRINWSCPPPGTRKFSRNTSCCACTCTMCCAGFLSKIGVTIFTGTQVVWDGKRYAGSATQIE